MQLMADGLAGHEHDFYRFVKDSSWLGGDPNNGEYSKLNEGFPYWFNGIVPLAYGLDNDRLKNQIQVSIEKVLDLQADDGWLGPEVGQARNFWARYPLFLGMVQLVEADAKYEKTVLPALHKFVELQNLMLKNDYEGYLLKPGDVLSEEDHGWGRIRVADMMITLQWLLEHDPAGQETELWENLDFLRRGAIDWAYWYQEGVYIKEDLSLVPENVVAPLFPYEHGVNVGQGWLLSFSSNTGHRQLMSYRTKSWRCGQPIHPQRYSRRNGQTSGRLDIPIPRRSIRNCPGRRTSERSRSLLRF